MSCTSSWQSQTDPPPLSEPEVHVWCACLDRLALGENFLSADEMDRRDRFYFERDRKRFIARRNALRLLIGRYLGLPPSDILLSYGKNGKPFLDKSLASSGLQFNVSHSSGLALYAFSLKREVGVDVEQIRVDFDIGSIAEHYFSPQEQKAINELPQEQKREAFFNCWTSKEAYIKALGEGLSLPLDSFDVSVAPGEHPRLLATRNDPAEAVRWELYRLIPAEGYVASLAVRGSASSPRCLQMDV